ncbi:MAG: preQ(1) synthase [Phycisphaerae bacterium]
MPRPSAGAALLETFPNPAPQRAYVIRHEAPEFTSRCPKTGQPDFGTVVVEYVADRLCVELKSLKLYFQEFRERGIFYEAVTNQILDDLVRCLRPRKLRVETQWRPRGGLSSTVTAEYAAPATRGRRRA